MQIEEGEEIDTAKYLTPISLTEDWWPKFGYECVQEFAGHISELAEERLGIPFDLYNDAGIAFIESLPIHKIQNLYHALTDEELEMKQPA